MKNIDVYQKVTDKLMQSIKQGVMPWQMTWKNGLSMNGVSKKTYSGINVWLLNLSILENEFNSNIWLTFKQAKALGGSVKKGSKATFVTFAKKVEKKADEDEEENKKYFFMLKYYNVFNLDQIDGLDGKFEKVEKPNKGNKTIEEAQKIVDSYLTREQIPVVAGKPCYIPDFDKICCPSISKFTTSSEYYGTLFHEITHSTGAEKRLNREIQNKFGNEKYSKEEMVAEFGASYLRALTGINTDFGVENSASYIDSWSRVIRKDPKLMAQSATKAMQAVNFIVA